jgi:hypothetical protein
MSAVAHLFAAAFYVCGYCVLVWVARDKEVLVYSGYSILFLAAFVDLLLEIRARCLRRDNQEHLVDALSLPSQQQGNDAEDAMEAASPEAEKEPPVVDGASRA